jgi:3-methyladenine DNA glycosylase AlkC
MTENQNAFKHGLGEAAVRRIARTIKRAESSFPDQDFIQDALTGLESLELKARVNHVVGVLHTHLPREPLSAIDVLVRAGKDWNVGEPDNSSDGFAAWPVIEFVGTHGLEHLDESMTALRKLTSLFSAEFAIRGYIERYPGQAMELLVKWTRDADPHVRRLVSEGTRPRLPWGRRLKQFQTDPQPVLDLLEKLKDDESEYVRRSVANNLNDIAKDHPDTVVEVCRRWSTDATAERQWIIKRATRTLVKAGHPEALKLLGFDPDAKIVFESFSLTAEKIVLGGDLEFRFKIRSESHERQSLVIDYAIHHVKKNGDRVPKVFKLKTLELGPSSTVPIVRTHKFREITTRKYYSGRHALEILVNGKSYRMVEFDLVV